MLRRIVGVNDEMTAFRCNVSGRLDLRRRDLDCQEEVDQFVFGPSGLYSLKQYWYSLAPYGADFDDE